MKAWSVPASYAVGEHREWCGATIVCTREHYAGDAAEHPWDPGDGWSVAKAATLWAPNGPEGVDELRGLRDARYVACRGAESDRLYAVLDAVVGP